MGLDRVKRLSWSGIRSLYNELSLFREPGACCGLLIGHWRRIAMARLVSTNGHFATQIDPLVVIVTSNTPWSILTLSKAIREFPSKGHWWPCFGNPEQSRWVNFGGGYAVPREESWSSRLARRARTEWGLLKILRRHSYSSNGGEEGTVATPNRSPCNSTAVRTQLTKLRTRI